MHAFHDARSCVGLSCGLFSRICLHGYGFRRVGVRGEVSGSNVYMVMAPSSFKSDFALKGISVAIVIYFI